MSIELTQQEREWLDTVRPENEWDYDPERLRVETEAVVERILAARLAQEREHGVRMHKAILDQVVLATKTAKAEAWDEGRQSVALDMMQPLGDDMTRPSTRNPYRDQP